MLEPTQGGKPYRVIIVRCIGYAIVYFSAQMRTRCHLQPLVNLGTQGGVQIVCTCTARVACTSSPSFKHHLVTLIKLCQCAKFCVARSTFPKIRGSPVTKCRPPLARAVRIRTGPATPDQHGPKYYPSTWQDSGPLVHPDGQQQRPNTTLYRRGANRLHVHCTRTWHNSTIFVDSIL